MSEESTEERLRRRLMRDSFSIRGRGELEPVVPVRGLVTVLAEEIERLEARIADLEPSYLDDWDNR